MALRKFEEGLVNCNLALVIEPNNAQIKTLKDKCNEELNKIKLNQQVIDNKQHEIYDHWTTAWNIMSGDNKNTGSALDTVSVGYASANQQPAQLQEVLPHIISDGNDSSVAWPVVMLYPQYGQIDVIQGLNADDMLAMHLAEMFPELADLDSTSFAVDWDQSREYQVSRLAVYVGLETAPRIHTLEEWLDSCKELSELRGELGSENSEKALEIAKKRNKAHELRLSYCKQSEVSSSNNSISKKNENNDSRDKEEFSRGGFLDVHLGCTFRHILKAPGHVLAGGLLTLLVFVKNNSAHVKFLKDIKINGHGVWTLEPNGGLGKRIQ